MTAERRESQAHGAWAVPIVWRHRPRFDTIEAFEYTGNFPLSFLQHGETVRRAAAGSSSCVVEQNGDSKGAVTVNLHQYVVRDLATGRIRAETATDWFRKYERTSEVTR